MYCSSTNSLWFFNVLGGGFCECLYVWVMFYCVCLSLYVVCVSSLIQCLSVALRSGWVIRYVCGDYVEDVGVNVIFERQGAYYGLTS